MGQIHARNLAALPAARLRAVASHRSEVARKVASECQAERVYTDYEALYSDPELDAVVIATACEDHPSDIVQAANHGLQIFAEKPIGFTLEGIRQALAAVERAGVHLQVGFMRRFDPAYAEAKRKIEEGAIGRPVLFRACSRDPFWPEKQDSPGANTLLLDLGVHDFDLARWLVGSEVVEVQAAGTSIVYPELGKAGDADNAVINLKFASGALGTIDFSRNARYGYDIRTEIIGDEGALFVGRLQQTPLLLLNRSGVRHDVYPWYAERFEVAFREEISAFVETVLNDQPSKPDAEDGLLASKIALAAVASMESGQAARVAE
jgi:inositol 2-dehydrogenase